MGKSKRVAEVGITFEDKNWLERNGHSLDEQLKMDLLKLRSLEDLSKGSPYMLLSKALELIDNLIKM